MDEEKHHDIVMDERNDAEFPQHPPVYGDPFHEVRSLMTTALDTSSTRPQSVVTTKREAEDQEPRVESQQHFSSNVVLNPPRGPVKPGSQHYGDPFEEVKKLILPSRQVLPDANMLPTSGEVNMLTSVQEGASSTVGDMHPTTSDPTQILPSDGSCDDESSSHDDDFSTVNRNQQSPEEPDLAEEHDDLDHSELGLSSDANSVPVEQNLSHVDAFSEGLVSSSLEGISLGNAAEIMEKNDLELLGYYIDQQGILRKLEKYKEGGAVKNRETLERYNYQEISQEEYNNIATAVAYEIHKRMCQRNVLPLKISFSPRDDNGTYIFGTEQVCTFVQGGGDVIQKLLVLVPGSGPVVAGQWSRKVCLSDGLDMGSMLPYIDRAIEMGYAVLLANGNHAQRKKVPENTTPQEHLLYLWDKLISKLTTKSIVFVAHSAGASQVMNLVDKRSPSKEKVIAITLTDPVQFCLDRQAIKQSDQEFLERVTGSWVASHHPTAGIPLSAKSSLIKVATFSAGHALHEWTSGAAISSVFKFIRSSRALSIKSSTL